MIAATIVKIWGKVQCDAGSGWCFCNWPGGWSEDGEIDGGGTDGVLWLAGN